MKRTGIIPAVTSSCNHLKFGTADRTEEKRPVRSNENDGQSDSSICAHIVSEIQLTAGTAKKSYFQRYAQKKKRKPSFS